MCATSTAATTTPTTSPKENKKSLLSTNDTNDGAQKIITAINTNDHVKNNNNIILWNEEYFSRRFSAFSPIYSQCCIFFALVNVLSAILEPKIRFSALLSAVTWSILRQIRITAESTHDRNFFGKGFLFVVGCMFATIQFHNPTNNHGDSDLRQAPEHRKLQLFGVFLTLSFLSALYLRLSATPRRYRIATALLLTFLLGVSPFHPPFGYYPWPVEPLCFVMSCLLGEGLGHSIDEPSRVLYVVTQKANADLMTQERARTQSAQALNALQQQMVERQKKEEEASKLADSMLNHTLKNILSDAIASVELYELSLLEKLNTNNSNSSNSTSTSTSSSSTSSSSTSSNHPNHPNDQYLLHAKQSMKRGMTWTRRRQSLLLVCDGTYQMQHQNTSLSSILEECIDGRSSHIDAKILLQHDHDDDDDDSTIQVDSMLVALATENGISNALKHSPKAAMTTMTASNTNNNNNNNNNKNTNKKPVQLTITILHHHHSKQQQQQQQQHHHHQPNNNNHQNQNNNNNHQQQPRLQIRIENAAVPGAPFITPEVEERLFRTGSKANTTSTTTTTTTTTTSDGIGLGHARQVAQLLGGSVSLRQTAHNTIQYTLDIPIQIVKENGSSMSRMKNNHSSDNNNNTAALFSNVKNNSSSGEDKILKQQQQQKRANNNNNSRRSSVPSSSSSSFVVSDVSTTPKRGMFIDDSPTARKYAERVLMPNILKLQDWIVLGETQDQINLSVAMARVMKPDLILIDENFEFATTNTTTTMNHGTSIRNTTTNNTNSSNSNSSSSSHNSNNNNYYPTGTDIIKGLVQHNVPGLLCIRSGNSSPEDIQKYANAGAHVVICKSYPSRKLEQPLREGYQQYLLLQQQQEERARQEGESKKKNNNNSYNTIRQEEESNDDDDEDGTAASPFPILLLD